MNSTLEGDTTLEDFLTFNSSYAHKGDVSISDQLADFQRMRISALTKAAEMSPYVKKATIGPNSPLNKEEPPEPEPVKEEVRDEELLIEDKLRNDLRFTLIMKEYKTRLQEASEIYFKSLIENMVEKRMETIQKCQQRQNEECQKRLVEMKKMQLQREIYANDNLLILESARLDQQKSQVLNEQKIENMNRALEEQNKAMARFAAITDSHTKICICYNQITSIFNSEPINPDVYNKYVTSINAVIINITSIMEMCNTQATTNKEVKQAEVLALNIENIKLKILEELHDIKQGNINQAILEEQKVREELEQKKAEQAALQEPTSQATTAAPKSIPKFYSPKNYNYYEQLSIYLQQYEAQYQGLLEDVSFKNFRFDCQKAVNIPLNAIASVSGSHMRDKYNKLFKLLKGEKVQVLDTYVTATQHPQGVAYCTALLAKKIAQQGESLVSSKPEAAFPLAAITVTLWTHFPEFGKLLEAYFLQMCPYLVPMFLQRQKGQTETEFYLSRGYTCNENGVFEKHDKFLKRMSGIFQLCCAIWIAKTPKSTNASNPHGLQYGWQWLASFINLKPEPDICATLLHDFFKVCGAESFKHYGKQFTKIIRLISNEYLPIIQDIDEGGPKSRLEIFLQNVLKTECIEPPTGSLENNAW